MSGPVPPDSTSHEAVMRPALAEARAGAARGNLAVGAIVLRNGAIIARGHNEVARGCEWPQRIAPESR